MRYDLHTKGPNCKRCCCSGPKSCKEAGCSGFIHLWVVDEIEIEDNNWEWVHNYKCDTCQFQSYFLPESPIEFENQNDN